MVAVAAVMTALKTGKTCCGHALRFSSSRHARAVDMHRYERARAADRREAARWEMRYQIGAMIYAVALGVVHGGACSAATMPSPT